MRTLFLFFAVAAVVWIGLKLWRRPAAAARGRSPRGKGVTVRRCALCGVHVPETEAIRAGDVWYCSRKHLEADTSRKD